MVTAGTELELLVFELDWKTGAIEADHAQEPAKKKKDVESEDIAQGDMQNVSFDTLVLRK